MNRFLMSVGAIVCFLGVAIGAFGAHALSSMMQGKAIGWYQTAFQYQFFHGLALLVCGAVFAELGRGVMVAGILLIAGILIFCGTLYAMALGAPSWLGMITPVGGVCFLVGWGVLIVCTFRYRNSEK